MPAIDALAAKVGATLIGKPTDASKIVRLFPTAKETEEK